MCVHFCKNAKAKASPSWKLNGEKVNGTMGEKPRHDNLEKKETL